MKLPFGLAWYRASTSCFGRAADVALQAFDVATCAQAKAALPSVPVYLLAWLGRERRAAAKAWLKALATVRREGLDGLGINNAPVLNERVVAELRAEKLRLNVWTIDRVASAKRLVRLGVDGIITNRPAWLKARVLFSLES